MARGKKSNATNKKKKGKSRSRSRAAGNTAGNAAAGPKIPSNVLQGISPDNWKEYEKAKALYENYPTVYSRYKQATNRFMDYMIDKCPEDVVRGGKKKSVDVLSLTADWMEAQQHVLPRSILRDLKLAIRLRSRVAKSVYGGGDAGHAHFNKVLRYCWTVLNRLPKQEEAVNKIAEAPPTKEENRFAALIELENENEDMEEDEELFPTSPIARPEPMAEPLSLEDLMKAEDRMEAILFLDSIDEMMGFVSTHYKSILTNYNANENEGVPQLALIEKFLEASVATNMMIQKVQQLQADLEAQHEHFTTPYRLLATLVLPDVTRHVTDVLRKHASKRCDEKRVSSFLGDCLECCFRNPSDDLNRKDAIVQEFCTELQVDETGFAKLQETVAGCQNVVYLEVPIGPELYMNAGIMGIASRLTGTTSHSWLPNSKFIGGDRSIHHTIRLLQMFGGVVRTTPDDRLLVPKKGFFGSSPWRPGRARKIHGDLDELLMSDIMPSWVTMCRKGIIGLHKLPRENELCPLLVQLRTFVEDAGRPVNWAIAFAVHAMLTAVLETDEIFDQIVDISKLSFGMYFDQVKHAAKIATKERDTHVSRASAKNMMSIGFLENLGLPVFGDRAIFNPLCGGTIISYVCYFGNMEAGLALLDCRSQLRITLHLYHALLENGFLTKGQIPFLDLMYDAFRPSRAVWEGPLPKKGEFCQRFWTCFGMNAVNAKTMAQMALRDIGGHCVEPSDDALSLCLQSFRTRKLKPIEPSEISTSFRRICDRDFRGVKDKYHTPEQRRKAKDTELYEVAVRVNDTLDAIEAEQSMLAFNFVESGAQMEQFVCSLGRILQWDPFMSRASVFGNDKRQGFVFLFAQYLLGALDFAEDPFSHPFLGVPMGEAAAHITTTYFNMVTPELVHWWQPVVEVE